MFKLLRYFTVTSAIVMVLAVVLFAHLHRSMETDEYQERTSRENLQIVVSIARTAWPQIRNFVEQASSLTPEQLRARPEVAAMDRTFRTMVGELPVLKVKVFDRTGYTVYSSDPAQIGRRKLPGSPALDAIEGRHPVHSVYHRDHFVGLTGTVTNVHLVSTYYPVIGDEGTVEGLFEVYSDVTALHDRLVDDVLHLTTFLATTFAVLFAILSAIAYRAQTIMTRQHRELEDHRNRTGETRRRLRTIADFTHDWESWIAPDGTPLWVSPSVERLVGFGVEDCLGMADYPLPLVHEADRDLVARHLERATAGTPADDVEFRVVCANGATKWVLASYQPVFEEDGTFLGSRWSTRDITPRKRAIQMLRESELRFRSVAESAADAIVSINTEGRIIAWNPAARDIFGYGEEEVLGRDVSILMPERYHAAHNMRMARHRDDETARLEVTAAEFAALHKNGHEFPVELSLSRWEMEGRPFFTAILRDVTDRKQAEERLRFTQISMEAAGDAIFWMNPDGSIFFVNDAACRYLGYQRDELTRMTVRDINPTYTAENWRALWRDLKESGAKRFETTHRSKDGTLLPVEIAATYLAHEGREYDIAIVRDISERKEAEARIERSNLELQQFAYVASHDLQEPLRMVTSYLELLKRRYGDDLDETAIEFVDYAVDGSKRMQNLIRDLLDYSRIETKGAAFEATDLERVLDLALNNLEARIEETGAIIAHDGLPTLQADANQMIRLFQNVIGNAIKYHKPDEVPRVKVSAERVGTDCVITVSDNGIGIPDKHFERIFGVFQRLHGRDEYEGTGIGLAICKRIVERHGGQISVDSTEGEGTTFTIRLPAGDGA